MFSYPNRTICAILSNIREMDKTKNYAGLLGAVAEIQWAAERMEAAIADLKDIDKFKEKKSELRDEIKKLEKKTAALKKKAGIKEKKEKRSIYS